MLVLTNEQAGKMKRKEVIRTKTLRAHVGAGKVLNINAIEQPNGSYHLMVQNINQSIYYLTTYRGLDNREFKTLDAVARYCKDIGISESRVVYHNQENQTNKEVKND